MKLSDKVRESLIALPSGQTARVKCVSCSSIITFDPLEALGGEQETEDGGRTLLAMKAPPPPDLQWLRDGDFSNQDVIEDVSRSMVLMPPGESKNIVTQTMEGLGYVAEQPESAEIALDRLEFLPYASVFLHEEYEPGGFASGTFYRAMRAMNMIKRRYIFFVLIGKNLHTLYNLEALSLSANLTVREDDLPLLHTVLRKAIPDYDELFGPYIDELRIIGK
ncbi:MAG: hypothetical protein LBU39_00950 [Desulfobulbaceae bacterium]|jgi:hypothetical protein|nr:hypothetical protein [Desulfobulbaceae bacterium]